MKNTIVFLLLFPVSAWMIQAETIPGLGTATFPTSTRSAAAQKDFIRGLLLLHVFEYSDAAEAFVAAEKIDPSFAMAYWGEAMTFNHPVWNEVDVNAGRAALAKFGATPEARAGRIADPRERTYLSAVEILYSGKGAKRERDEDADRGDGPFGLDLGLGDQTGGFRTHGAIRPLSCRLPFPPQARGPGPRS